MEDFGLKPKGQGQNLAKPQWLGRISKVPAIERKPEELRKRIRRPQHVRNSVLKLIGKPLIF